MSDHYAGNPFQMTDWSEHLDPLRRVLSSLADRAFLFVRPGGNWGDNLIYLGAERLAFQLGLKWRTLYYEQFVEQGARPDEVIYLQGGGGYTEMASGKAPRCLRKALQTAGATVIQGPCTVSTDSHGLHPLEQDVRNMRAERLFFFARERKSAAIAVSELPPHVEVVLNEDTAFYLDRDALLNGIRPPQPRIHLIAVRKDTEAIIGGGCADSSKSVIDPAYYARSFEHWLRIHAASKTIVTNRTHSAICGVILGVPTTMFGGAYHKNRSIWEFSLHKRGVEWLSDLSAVPVHPEIDQLLEWIPISRVRRSWKLDRLAKWFRGVPLS